METRRTFSVTWPANAGDLLQQDLVSTLAVFYDQVWLPYPYDTDPSCIQLLEIEPEVEYMAQQYPPWVSPHKSREFYGLFRRSCKPLFDANVFRILEPPITRLDEGIFGAIRREMEKGVGLSAQSLPFTALWLFVEQLPATVYALYSKKIHPEFFAPRLGLAQKPAQTTSALAQGLAHALFSYQVPQLQELTAEELLEVREYTKDTREGFACHLFEITDDLEGRIRSGEKFDEAARKIVERKLLTKYSEYRRQLASRKVGFWSRVLAAGSKFFKIDATPWTPKFYGELFEILFSSLDDTTKTRIEELTNQNQALQHIAKLEDSVGRGSSQTTRKD